jgi:hypothetical protein
MIAKKMHAIFVELFHFVGSFFIALVGLLGFVWVIFMGFDKILRGENGFGGGLNFGTVMVS